jgi:MtN3 and saliva related transmembrane protein
MMIPTPDATTLAYAAAILSTVAYLPQALKIILTRDTKAISLTMYATMILGIGAWTAYGMMVNVFPIMLSNAITLLLLCTIFVMKLMYR